MKTIRFDLVSLQPNYQIVNRPAKEKDVTSLIKYLELGAFNEEYDPTEDFASNNPILMRVLEDWPGFSAKIRTRGGTSIDIAETADVEADLKFDDGCLIMPGARISDDCRLGSSCLIGEHVRLQRGCHLNYNTQVGRSTTLRDKVNLGAYTRVGDMVTLGRESVIGSNVSIGRHSTIGHNCHIDSHAKILPDTSIPAHQWIPESVTIGPKTWYKQFSNVGSRQDRLFVYDDGQQLRWTVGCQNNLTTYQFRARIADYHKRNQFAREYRSIIDWVEQQRKPVVKKVVKKVAKKAVTKHITLLSSKVP